MEFPRLTPVADHAVLVEFAEALDDDAHGAVLRLDAALAAHPCAGLREVVPAFVSLLIDFDACATDHARVMDHARSLMRGPAQALPEGRLREVAVCYDDDLAPDLAEVARRTGLTPEAVIAAHVAGGYRVAMYGFAPGYAYLASLPQPIRLDRKPAPLRGVPAGSVLIAGGQCLVSTLTMPTGWWIIGRSPTRILDAQGARPFLFDVGDRVRFRRVTRAALEAGR